VSSDAWPDFDTDECGVERRRAAAVEAGLVSVSLLSTAAAADDDDDERRRRRFPLDGGSDEDDDDDSDGDDEDKDDDDDESAIDFDDVQPLLPSSSSMTLRTRFGETIGDDATLAAFGNESDAGGVDDTDDKDDDGGVGIKAGLSRAGASRAAGGRDSTMGLATATTTALAAGFE
jgi:hypothetical protein